jgi:Flp pilus assembly pilin Flp
MTTSAGIEIRSPGGTVSPSTLSDRRVHILATLAPPGPTTRPGPSTRLARLVRDDSGMSTVEYAIGTIAAAAFAAVLYAVVSGDSIVTALTQLVQRALTANF